MSSRAELSTHSSLVAPTTLTYRSSLVHELHCSTTTWVARTSVRLRHTSLLRSLVFVTERSWACRSYAKAACSITTNVVEDWGASLRDRHIGIAGEGAPYPYNPFPPFGWSILAGQPNGSSLTQLSSWLCPNHQKVFWWSIPAGFPGTAYFWPLQLSLHCKILRNRKSFPACKIF